MTIDSQNKQLEVISHAQSIAHGQIEQLPGPTKAMIDAWLVPLHEIPGLIKEAETTGKVDPVLAMLQRLAAAEGYSPHDPRLEPILREQAESFITDIRVMKEKAICYMALCYMYIERVQTNHLYLYAPGCDTVEDYCRIHINMDSSFLRQVQQVGECINTLYQAGCSILDIFNFPLDKITYAFIKGLQEKLDNKMDEGIIKEAKVAYPRIYEAAFEEIEDEPVSAPRGREAVLEQKALARKILEKLPVTERRELNEKVLAETQDYARSRINEIVSPEKPGDLLANHAESKGEVPKELAYIVFECTYDEKTGKFHAEGDTIITHEQALCMERGQWRISFTMNKQTGVIKLSEVGAYITACTYPTTIVNSTLSTPTHEF